MNNITGSNEFRRDNSLARITNAKSLTRVPATTKAAQLARGGVYALTTNKAAAVSKAQSIPSSVDVGFEDAAGDLAKALGLHDFYSAHLMSYCEGYFMSGPVPNASVSREANIKNVTACSNMTINHLFDPQSILQQQLSSSSVSDRRSMAKADHRRAERSRQSATYHGDPVSCRRDFYVHRACLHYNCPFLLHLWTWPYRYHHRRSRCGS